MVPAGIVNVVWVVGTLLTVIVTDAFDAFIDTGVYPMAFAWDTALARFRDVSKNISFASILE